MPCKNACVIIDTIYINIYKKKKKSFLFIRFQKCKGLKNSHNYLFIAKFIKRKIAGEEKKHMKLEVWSLETPKLANQYFMWKYVKLSG